MLCVDLDVDREVDRYVDLDVDLVDELHGCVDDAGEGRAVRVQVPGPADPGAVVHLSGPVSGAPVRVVNILQVLSLLILELRENI